MRTTELNAKLVDGYLELLENLSPASKLELIGKLTHSIKLDLQEPQEPKESFEESFGAWDEGDDAQELIKKIRNSRMFSRKIVEL